MDRTLQPELLDSLSPDDPAARHSRRGLLKADRWQWMCDAPGPQLGQKRRPRPVIAVVTHAGGVDVLAALSAALPDHPLEASAAVLRDYGNMSSPSVLFALEGKLRTMSPGSEGDFWLVSFGAGFSAHSCRFGSAPNPL